MDYVFGVLYKEAVLVPAFLSASSAFISVPFFLPGGMAEWSMAAVLKTVSPKGDVGSNPTPSARNFAWQILPMANGL